MDIHENADNAQEEITETNTEEMNPYAGINLDIPDDNVVMTIKECIEETKETNQDNTFDKLGFNANERNIEKLTHTNNAILKRSRPLAYVPSAKQMIKSGRLKSTTQLCSSSFDRMIKGQPALPEKPKPAKPAKPAIQCSPWYESSHQPDAFLCQQPHRVVDSLDIRDGDTYIYQSQDPFSMHPPFSMPPFSIHSHTPDAVISEKPKEVNMAEIITSALQDVLTGKISSIESVIGKLRVEFEEKSVFKNALKRNVALLHFGDDNIRPVLQIDTQYMTIIQEWYAQCGLDLDVEETNVSIPETITVEDIKDVLFQNIHINFKDEYLHKYLPLVINDIISARIIKDFEKIHFKTPSEKIVANSDSGYESLARVPHGANTLYDLGIIVPNNMLSPTRSIESAYCPPPPSLLGRSTEDMRNRVDPELAPKYFIPVQKGEQQHTVLHNPELDCKVKCYNEDYNVMRPKFGEACLRLDAAEVSETAKPQKKQTSICVLMNSIFYQTMTIIDPSEDVQHIMKHHPEFGFARVFGVETDNQDIIQHIEKEFNHVEFEDVEEINAKLLMTSQYIELANKHNKTCMFTTGEETQVKQMLQTTYTINDDINHKMKASALHDIIANSSMVKIDPRKASGFRTRLSKYLKDIGLQKKRYNDGYYYYGIVEKRKPFASEQTRDNKPCLTIDEIMRTRDLELNINNIIDSHKQFTSEDIKQAFGFNN